MSSAVHKNGNYTIKRDSFIAVEGSGADTLNLLLQGNLDVFITSSKKESPVTFEDLRQKSYRLFDLDQNIFIGANDIVRTGTSSLTLTASTDCSLYAYVADNAQNLIDFINCQKDYGSYVLNSICTLITNSEQAFRKLSQYCRIIERLYINLCTYYMAIADEYHLNPHECMISQTGSAGLALRKSKNILVPVYFSKQFIESVSPETIDSVCEASEICEEIDYYTHLYNIPAELKKSFFAADQYITRKHIIGASSCLEKVLAKLHTTITRLEDAIEQLYSENDDNCYQLFLKAAYAMRLDALDYTPALSAANYICDKLKEISANIEFEYRHNIGIDFEYLEHTHKDIIASLKSPQTEGIDTSLESIELSGSHTLPEELVDSVSTILKYAEMPEDKEINFMMNLTAFRNLKDRLSADESARTIRSALTDLYFEIYQKVYTKAYQTKNQSRLIKMFLNFGYMDEKLLDYDQTMGIFKLAGENHETGIANVYYMSDWLDKIYSMEKDPSINNFGNDYFDTFRELKKQGKLSDKDKAAYERDNEGRLSFEVNHMLRLNHRLCHGQIALYFPIIHKDMAPYKMDRSLVTPEIICEKLGKILNIDYSAFHREIHYRSPSENIEKEIVMMQVIPDFILVPVYGIRAMMWQEITGRRRNTPGRLILPVFTDENLDDMLLRLVGNFRWELCRVLMGSAWNNIAQSSLTSEYADYIQFYKKNRDLSEEAKERVKSLTTKYNNRLRDIFTSDYEMWINNESKGNPRMNKVARSIFFKFCPFSKEIRDHLERQPIYTDFINITKNQRTKIVRELDNRYKRYIKANEALNPVLQSNLEFYRDT